MQNWVNGWVSVNQQHLVFPSGDRVGESSRRQPGRDHVMTAQHSSAASPQAPAAVYGGPLPMSESVSTGVLRNKGEAGDVSQHSIVNDGSATSGTGGARRIRNRRLRRTNSQSDIIRGTEKIGKTRQRNQPSSNLQTRTTATHRMGGVSDTNHAMHASQHSQNPAVETQPKSNDHGGLKWVSGLFGGGKQESQQNVPPPPPQTTVMREKNPYLNEAAFLQQQRQRQLNRNRLPSQESIDSAASTVSLTHRQTPSPNGSTHLQSLYAQTGPLHIKEQDGRLLIPHGLIGSASFKKPEGGAVRSCSACQELEAQLLAAHIDLDYLRNLAINDDNRPLSTNDAPELLQKASRRHVEIAARHRRQMEQMAREQKRWQQDMHMKLSKSALMCKGLNEESAKRKVDAKFMELQLQNVTSERDDLAQQVRELQAQLDLNRVESSENTRLQQMLEERDNEMMDTATKAIEERDELIRVLSSRLQTTLNTLERERGHQRQRRQIIFPNQTDVSKLTDDVARARADARAAELALAAAKEEAAVKEQALQAKCQELTQQLKEAGLEPE